MLIDSIKLFIFNDKNFDLILLFKFIFIKFNYVYFASKLDKNKVQGQINN